MVDQDQTEMFLNLNHHPVCAASDASHFSSYWRSHPSWPGGAMAQSAKYVIAADGRSGFTFPL